MKVRTPSSRAAEQMGLRIRKARLDLGLSIAAVAGTQMSRPFLNLIELGRARPSLRTLRVIADRLQRPIEYFLEDSETSGTALELALTEAESCLQRGDATRAESVVAKLMERQNVPPETRARAQLLLADARLSLGAAQDAIAILDKAITASRAARWTSLAVELYDRMGMAHHMLHRQLEAARWFDKALLEYEASRLDDPILKARLLGHRANLHYILGEPEQAIAAYQSAIAAAEHILDIQGLASTYEGLALSFERTGQLGRALSYAQRGLRLFESMQDIRMSAQLCCSMASIILQQGKYQDAERLFLEGAERLRSLTDRELLPKLLAGAAEAALESGDLERAQTRSMAALAAADASTDPLARIAAARVGGRVHCALGRWAEARSLFEQALKLADDVENKVGLSRVAYDYARTLEAQGEVHQAALRYREAYEARQAAVGS